MNKISLLITALFFTTGTFVNALFMDDKKTAAEKRVMEAKANLAAAQNRLDDIKGVVRAEGKEKQAEESVNYGKKSLEDQRGELGEKQSELDVARANLAETRSKGDLEAIKQAEKAEKEAMKAVEKAQKEVKKAEQGLFKKKMVEKEKESKLGRARAVVVGY